MALNLSGTSGITGAGIGTIGPSGSNITGVVTCTSVVSSGAGSFGGNVEIASGSLHVGDEIVHYGDTDTNIGFPAANTFTVDTGGSERLRITSGGDLALGHTSAARGPLHIHKDSADCYFHVTNSTTGTTSSDGFTLHQGGVETIINNREAGNMRFYTNGTERVRIDMNGNTNITGITTATHFNPTGQPYGTKNLVINGSMQVAQRATSSTTSGYGSLDRWNVTMGNTDEAFTHSKIDLTSSDTGPWAEGFHNAMRIQNGNQTSGWQTNSHGVLHQHIEDQNIAQSGWQIESTSSYITVSYWIRSSVAQAFGGHIETYDGTDKTWMWSTGTLSANTWTTIVKTIGGDSALSMSDNSGRGLQIQPWFIWGTDYTASDATLNGWAAYNGSKRFTDMTSTWWTTNNATVDITGVQIEVGKVQTPFEHKSFADHLLDCQRYYQQLPVSGDHVMWGFGRAESNSARVQIPLSRPLRAAPTITASNFRTCNVSGTMLQSTTTPTVFKWDDDFASIILDFPSGGSLNHNNVYIVTSDGGSTGLQMNSEL